MTKAQLHHSGRADFALADSALAVLRRHLKPGLSTLETGAGHSTLAFAAAGCRHTAISPAIDEWESIQGHARTVGIDLSHVRFIAEPSQVALPKLAGRIDVVLLDGGHGYPLPQIDFFYAALLLNPGGILAIDNVELWSVRALWRFLRADAEFWEHLTTVDGQTGFFRLRQPFRYREWSYQQPTVRWSRTSRRVQRAQYAWGLLRRGAVRRLLSKLRQRFLA